MGLIYQITNILNGKIYIGQTTRKLKYRWRDHILLSTKPLNVKTPLITRALHKNGSENFTIAVIEEVPDAQLDEREIFHIAATNSTNREVGYNMTAGGIRTVWTDEMRLAARNRQLGKPHPRKSPGPQTPEHIKNRMDSRKRNSKPGYWKGKTVPQETRDKIATALRGVSKSKTACANIAKSAKTRRWASEEHRMALGNAERGRIRSVEWRQDRSRKMKQYWERRKAQQTLEIKETHDNPR